MFFILYFKVCICVYQVVVDVYAICYLFFTPTSNFCKGTDLPILVYISQGTSQEPHDR